MRLYVNHEQDDPEDPGVEYEARWIEVSLPEWNQYEISLGDSLLRITEVNRES